MIRVARRWLTNLNTFQRAQADKDEKAAALEALVEALIPHRNKDVRSVPRPICSLRAA